VERSDTHQLLFVALMGFAKGSTLFEQWIHGLTLTVITREESVKKYRPHPEELAKQASRRMDTTHELAAILRDARKGALLRMRSKIYLTRSKRVISIPKRQ
jgi:hypothetical protein